ncbi:MAG: DNA repair protein RecN [Saccharofermentanales bacterium]
MLSRIEISDFALIESATLDIRPGFTILTGETGAGKSILIDAIGAVCGSRITRDMVRSDKEAAIINAVFDGIAAKIPPETLSEYGIVPDEDSLLLSREIYRNGKSYARINGRMVPVSALKTITSYLLDIHGQHENQAIFREDVQLSLLDRFGGETIKELLEGYRIVLSEFISVGRELKEFVTDEKQKRQLIDLLEYQINEIQTANPHKDEDIRLSERRKIITNAERIIVSLEKALYLLNGESDMPALPAVKEAANQISGQLSSFSEYDLLSETLNDISYRLEDLCDNISKEIGNVEVFPGEAKKIDDRLDVLYNLKHKYGGSIEAVAEHHRQAVARLDRLKSGEERTRVLLARKAVILKTLAECSYRLYEERSKVAITLERAITSELSELGMQGTRFSADLKHSDSEKEFSAEGQDTLEFLISPNIGEELRSLSRIASGGEASRIMLAIKTILADSDSIPVLIFDEIDTGISGKTAGLLGEKMMKIAGSHQVFCVTHMAQIAAKAHNHIHIEKSVRNDRTFTDIRYIEADDRIAEIARLLSGDENKGEAVELAKAMLS